MIGFPPYVQRSRVRANNGTHAEAFAFQLISGQRTLSRLSNFTQNSAPRPGQAINREFMRLARQTIIDSLLLLPFRYCA